MRFDQLPAALQKAPAPLWLVTGQEPLLMIEAADAIRHRAIECGYSEREIYNASAIWDWSVLTEACRSMSLFSQKKIIELRLSSFKPGTRGAQALSELAQMSLDGVIVIVSLPYDWSIRKLAWFTQLSAAAQTVECSAVPPGRLCAWFADRLRQQNQSADPQALQLLSDRCEGNLLAGKQELLKLAFRYPAGAHITTEIIDEAVSDVSRFDTDALLNATLGGDAQKAVRIVQSLREEGLAIPFFLWPLTEEIRQSCRVRSLVDSGQSRDAALRTAGVFGPQKIQRVQAAVRRLSTRKLTSALMLCADIDRLSKGLTVSQRDSDAWIELTSLVSFLARS